MKDTLPVRVRFGAFELDLRVGELRLAGAANEADEASRVLLPEQPFRLLVMLVEREGNIATRDEIQKRLWPNDTLVEFEHSIHAAINKLRKALGDSADEPQYIETIPRRGYRLMVPVERIARAEVSPGVAGAPVAGGAGPAVRMQPDSGALTGRTVSHYRVLDIIGGGGMGVVYRAEDLKLGRRVALKFLPEELGSDPQALERFSREARAASSLDHPNICPIFEFGEHEGRPFMVMQLLEGQTLRERLAAGEGAFPLEELLDIGIQVSDGLQAAHERGIIHRDIKPANIFLTNKGVCKILDFGLAKLLEVGNGDEVAAQPEALAVALPDASGASHLSRSGVALGTAAYMSPEQVRGEKVDARTDLFSFGLVLYEMATGRRAFSGDTVDELHEAILNQTPTSVQEVRPDLPPQLEQIINKAVEKGRELRYQHDAELRTDLQRLKRNSSSVSNTIDAVPWPAPPVLPWWRSKLAFGMGGLVLAGMIVAAVFYWWHTLSSSRLSGPRLTHRRITFVGDAYMPAISPDGKSVAYLIRQPESEPKLMLQDLSGGPSLELLHVHWLGPLSWSPDGSELMLGPLVVSRLGGTPRLVGRGNYSCWLPDGSQIASTHQVPDMGIWLLNKLTGAEKKIPAPAYQYLFDIDCSAKLLLLTQTSSKYQIWTMKPDGTEQRKLIEGESGITFLSPRWSPAGDAIYYLRKEGGITDLVRLPASGQSTGSSVLVSGLETGDYFTLSADGSQLVYTRIQSYSNLWLVDLPAPGATAEARGKPLTSGTLSYDRPSISPDGRWMAFTIGSDTKGNVYKMTIDGGQPIQLTFFDAAGTYSPAWSPDGRQIAFICDQGGTPKVWTVNAEGGGAARPLDKTNASDTDYELAWSPSPEIFYQPPGLHNLRRLNVETHEERPLLSNDLDGWLTRKPMFSPDGTKIAIRYIPGRTVPHGAWVFTLERFSEGRLYPNVNPLGWSSDGNFIYAVSPSGREILQIGLGDPKKPRSVITMPGDIKAGTVSPDGRKIIVDVGEEKSDVWLMKDFDPQTARAK